MRWAARDLARDDFVLSHMPLHSDLAHVVQHLNGKMPVFTKPTFAFILKMPILISRALRPCCKLVLRVAGQTFAEAQGRARGLWEEMCPAEVVEGGEDQGGVRAGDGEALTGPGEEDDSEEATKAQYDAHMITHIPHRV